MKLPLSHPIILDGGMGRELQQMGAPFAQPQWSAQALIEAPHFVSKAHQRFLQAGAQVITTNAYALVPFHIGEPCFNEQGSELIQLAARLAKECTKQYPSALVAGCLPPVLGSYRPDLFTPEQAAPLLEKLIVNQQADVDFWLAETISSIEEARVIKARTATTAQTTWLAFTVSDEIKSTATLRSGELVYDAVTEIAGDNVSAILFNCSNTDVMESALIVAKQALNDLGLADNVQLGVYANSFTPITDLHQANDSVTEIRQDITPEVYRDLATTWLAAGATIIGGCCGISPQHIEALASLRLAG